MAGGRLAVKEAGIEEVLDEEGVDFNVIKYNPLGSADFVNPNLDVAYLEAWIGVDDETAAVLEVPEITGRYYTAQFCDEWGEVITNINERNYPLKHGANTACGGDRQRDGPLDLFCSAR